MALEWFEVLVLFEQDTVGFILWKYGRHPPVLIEFDLERSPAFVDLFRAQFASNEVNSMKGQNGQEQMCFNLLILTMIDRTESEVGFHRSERPLNFSQLPIGPCKLLTGPCCVTGTQHIPGNFIRAGEKWRIRVKIS